MTEHHIGPQTQLALPVNEPAVGRHQSVPAITIIVLNWRGAADTLDCLESLLKLDWPFCRIVICDNASGDDSTTRFDRWADDTLPAINQERQSVGLTAYGYERIVPQQVRRGDRPLILVIETGANLGYAGGNNVGIRYALDNPPCDYVWVLNNDTLVAAEALTHLVGRVSADPDIGLCGSLVVYADKPNLVQAYSGGYFSKWTGRTVHLGWHATRGHAFDLHAIESRLSFVNGAAVFATRLFLEDVGLMEESYFLYFEEPDWGERARGLYKLAFAASSIVYHKVGKSIGTNDFGERSETSEYYLRRNRLLFCRKFARRAIPFSLLDVMRDAMRLILRRKYARARLVLSATLDGLFCSHRNYPRRGRP